MLGFSDEVESTGLSVRSQVPSHELRAPTEEETRALELAPQDQMVALGRPRSVGKQLRLLVHSTIAAGLVPGPHRKRL